MTAYHSRPREAQPVLDSLVEPISSSELSDSPPEPPEPKPYLDASQKPEFPTAPFHRPSRSGTHIQLNGDSGSRTPSTGPSRPRPGLLRAKSDFGPRREDQPARSVDEDGKSSTDGGEWGIRHGFEAQLVSEEYANLLTSNFFLYYTDKKHETGGRPKDREDVYQLQEWRMKDRLKTVSAVLALCLNIGVDPPDVIKTNPCAKMECWTDPTSSTGVSGGSVLSAIGKKLQQQYEQLSMRTRYRLSLDPTNEEAKRYCSNLRKSARNERILLHYNGHGVPKPTPSGELWVFNKNYTQYIPISLADLQDWLGAPTLLVYDCSEANLIISNYLKVAEKNQQLNLDRRRADPNAEVMDYMDCIHLGACREKENLPTNPDLPADVFTSCLTTPIETAVRFFILQNPLHSSAKLGDEAQIPGRISERRTPMGELNWIFTAITDTIAWNTLPKPLFKKLFRQDLMVAALFRNFLLAQRIMRAYRCHPVSYPEIPQTHDHPLWKSWDLAVEMVLSQLPALKAEATHQIPYEYQHSNFFAEQLTAFEVYLTQGGAEQRIPEQLPVVLQVLLSQVHRLRALILLSRFLDLGPWAVNLALSIGIFPYVLKLLQSQAMELKPVMVFIWARILAVDQSCQADLLKDGYQYFVSILNPSANVPVGNVSDHWAMCAFIIAMFCKGNHQGQMVCLSEDLFESCLGHLNNLEHPLLRQWSCLCISMLWIDLPEAKWLGIKRSAHVRLCELVVDPVAEVRAAMLHALTTFLGMPDLTPQIAQIEESIASMVLVMTSDGNTMVRNELLVFFSTFVARYQTKFLVAAYEQLIEEKANLSKTIHDDAADRMETLKIRSRANSIDEPNTVSSNTVFAAIWRHLLIMSVDPHPEVAHHATIVVDAVFTALLQSPLAKFARPLIDVIMQYTPPSASRSSHVEALPYEKSAPSTPPTPTKNEGYISASIKRTASVAASLKNYFGSSTNLAQENKGPSRSNSLVQAHGLAQRSRLPGDWNQPPDLKDPHAANAAYPALKIPEPRLYKRNPKQEARIPLVSHFYEWSIEYFREPQMRASEADEPGSTDYNERLWRRNRNDRIIAKTQPQKDMAGSNPWDRAKGFFNNGTQPMKMCFHQFEDHLIVTDDRDGVGIWDWKRQARLNRFSNGNPARSKITEVRLINEDDQALLMTGSSDGVVRLFRNYEYPKKVETVTAFRALTDLEPSNKAAGLVFDWQQSRGLILVAGDVRSIRVWNAGTEICTADINARSGSPITSLTSDQVEGHLFVAGFGDGALRLYDQREKPATAMVRVWKEHKAWVTNVHLQRGGQRELVSACRNGEVKLWDLRLPNALTTLRATRDTLRTLSVHEHAPVFAVGTDRHVVKIFSMMESTTSPAVNGSVVVNHSNGPVTAAILGSRAAATNGVNPGVNGSSNINGLGLTLRPNTSSHLNLSKTATNASAATALFPPAAASNAAAVQATPTGPLAQNPTPHLLSTFEPYSSFLNIGMHSSAMGIGRSAPVAATAFHPHRMMLAAAAVGDCHVNIYACRKGGDE